MSNPEVTLWRAVILQAFIDASARSGPGPGERTLVRLERARAREWLLTDSPGLRAICAVADVSPHIVIREARDRALRGWPLKRTAIGKHVPEGVFA